jgi:hypothetical protein
LIASVFSEFEGFLVKARPSFIHDRLENPVQTRDYVMRKRRSDHALSLDSLQATFERPNTAGLDQEEVDILFDPTKSFRWIIARLSRRLKALDKVSSSRIS